MHKDQAKKKIGIAFAESLTKKGHYELTGAAGASHVYALTRLYLARPQPMVIVTSDPKHMERLMGDLTAFSNRKIPVYSFPPYHLSPYKKAGYHTQTAATRIRTLYHLSENRNFPVVVTTIGAFIQRIIPQETLIDFSKLLTAGEEIDRERFVEKLIRGGYVKALLVEEPGDFSVRGGIIDVFSPFYDDPIRMEFFGDVIESIRSFSAVTQRTVKEISEAIILPAGEAVIREGSTDHIVGRIRLRAAELGLSQSRVREIAEQVKAGQTVSGFDGQLSLFYEHPETLMAYAAKDTLFILDDPSAIIESSSHFLARMQDSFNAVRREKKIAVPADALFDDWSNIRTKLADCRVLAIREIAGEAISKDRPFSGHIRMEARSNTDIQAEMVHRHGGRSTIKPVANWIRKQRDGGRAVILASGVKNRLEALKDLLKPYGERVQFMDAFPSGEIQSGKSPDTGDVSKNVIGCLADISSGFVWPDANLAILSELEIFGKRKRKLPDKTSSRTAELFRLEELKTGDIVVHQEHGIGRYDGLARLKTDGIANDYVKIIYKDDDRLYLPVDRLNILTKYLGVESVSPVLDKMGGKSWSRIKAGVKRSAEKIAGELLKLYASRKVSEGFSFRPRERLENGFAAGFEYEETPDQANAIDDVLADMSRPKPMDRLICGDVGYGKTEVALRAAHTAVSNHKQVAVLVPTTVLAEQHFATFSRRFNRTPYHVACLSRFRKPRIQREVVTGLKTGTIDIVIGTHRLLSKDVAFHDLGFVVMDEEQRFGVKHKEKLKKLRATVDVLTMTATPIPRTLHLSLVGVRDISVIATPPELRRPIVTHVMDFDETTIQHAVRRELERKGQLFFVHNHVRSIRAMADRIRTLVPEVRLDIAHGQMDEAALEQVMLRFFHREIDLLVCTTIIESGLDVPGANTMFINRADRFGLAQIYQLRGRIGRSTDQAHAYLFIPPESTLTKTARKRLKVLMEHRDLGAGFQIAMNDLKIRGGGTILGANQSGHVAAVGYEMFLQLMKTAVSEIKGEKVSEPLMPELNIPFSAMIPNRYIPEIDQRLSIYRHLSAIKTVRDIQTAKTDLMDRFGRLPREVVNLLFKMILGILCRRAGVKRLDIHPSEIVLYLSVDHQRQPEKIMEIVRPKPSIYRLTPDYVLHVTDKAPSLQKRALAAKNILKEIGRHVNPVPDKQ